MWGLSIFILWILFNDPWIAIIPPAFIAFGDAVIGFARNALFKKRTKHPIGNVFMLFVTIPIGYYFGGMSGMAIWGVMVAILSSFVERFEFGPIDDNVLIVVTSIVVLYLGKLVVG
ncbi:MAG: hypothetical protein ACOC85_03695 [Thermoplasmatota archaeon]